MTIPNDYDSMFFPLLGPVVGFVGNILRSYGIFHATSLGYFFGSSEESGATACVFLLVRRCSRCSQLTGSRFPVNRRSFRTYHLVEATSILPAL